MSGYRSIRAFEAVNGAMALLFFLGAAVQLNDPDPVRWFAIYFGAGAVSLICGRIRRGWQLAAVVSVVGLVWAAVMAPGVLPALQPARLAESMRAETPEIEQGRELLGLLIIGGWMLVSAGVRYRTARRDPE